VAEHEDAAADNGSVAVRPPRLSRSEWLLLLLLSTVQFTHIMDFMIVMPCEPQYQRELGISPRQFSFMVSAYAFSAAISGLLIATFIDRFDRKRALLGLYAGFTIGTLTCALAPGFISLVVARALAGGFGGVMAANVLAIVGDVFPDSKRGTATGVIMSAFSVASIAGIPAGLYLANTFGWRTPFQVLGALSAMVWVLALYTLPTMRGHLVRSATESDDTWEVLLHPAHLRAYLLMIALVMSTFMVYAYLSAFLVANVGVSTDDLPYVYLCGGLAMLVTLTPVGKLSDRFGKLPVFRILALFTVVPIFMLTNLRPVSLAATLAVTTLFMVVASARIVPAMALITASSLPRYRGSFMSINASVQQLAMALASLLAGALVAETAEGPLSGFGLVGIVCAFCTLLSIVLAGRLQAPEGDADALRAVDPLDNSSLPELDVQEAATP
jgi:predicted MFS family arabinose efflux permease